MWLEEGGIPFFHFVLLRAPLGKLGWVALLGVWRGGGNLDWVMESY